MAFELCFPAIQRAILTSSFEHYILTAHVLDSYESFCTCSPSTIGRHLSVKVYRITNKIK
jgi:hypothetical protein